MTPESWGKGRQQLCCSVQTPFPGKQSKVNLAPLWRDGADVIDISNLLIHIPNQLTLISQKYTRWN